MQETLNLILNKLESLSERMANLEQGQKGITGNTYKNRDKTDINLWLRMRVHFFEYAFKKSISSWGWLFCI